MKKRTLIVAFSLATLLIFSGVQISESISEVTTHPKISEKGPRPERIRDCLKETIVDVQISGDWLLRTVASDAKASNINQVRVNI